MADYIYLLETRLSPAQREALTKIRDVARSRAMTVFLVGGAVRDLTTGISIRDLDVTLQGNVLKLKKDLEKAGGRVVGTNDLFQSLYLTFPGGIRIEVASAQTVSYPKPGKPAAKPATILDDLHSRDFTANAMAISLNEGSYGLLMDPLNGIADIENRELRLVSNYGFIEDPSRMIRAVRLSARLGWALEEKTQQRYETGKAENYIEALGPWERSYELEEIFHEEDPLRIQRRLEIEGWNKVLFPAWTAAKSNETEVERLRDAAGQLSTMGIPTDTSAALFPLLTAKLGGKETAALKKAFARPGFVEEIESLEARTKALAAQLTGKTPLTPSETWKMLYAADPEAVLSLLFSSKNASIQQKFKLFFSDWPQSRSKIPYALMQEMRITPEIAGYDDLLEKLFFALMDAKLETPEQTKAFLEPYSPPAPPPPPNLRRRPAKRESKVAKPKAPKPPKPAPQAAAPADGARQIAVAAKPQKTSAAAKSVSSVKPEPSRDGTRPSSAKVPAKTTAGTSTKAGTSAAAQKKLPSKPKPAGKGPASKFVRTAPKKASRPAVKANAKPKPRPAVKKAVPKKRPVAPKKAKPVTKKSAVKKPAQKAARR